MLQKDKIKAIIFDVDGTLRDTDDEMVRGIELQLLRFEYFISSRKAQTIARKFVMRMENPAQKVLYYADKWGWDTAIHAFVNFVRSILRPFKKNNNYTSIAGIQAMIPELAKHYPLAVVSAGDEQTVKTYLEKAGIAPYFKCVATALTCPHTKPFADPLIWAANIMGVHPDNCVMVGDTTVDMLAGKNAGTQTIAVLCGFGERGELEALSPDLVLKSTLELLSTLKNR
jgi:N-acetyl-D-muramate 6-phosphate phosphatase